jgi:hypothetical protein
MDFSWTTCACPHSGKMKLQVRHLESGYVEEEEDAGRAKEDALLLLLLLLVAAIASAR